jgi:hypothetical protein
MRNVISFLFGLSLVWILNSCTKQNSSDSNNVNVYVGGNHQFWKNGKPVDLPGSFGAINADQRSVIAVRGNVVYTAGPSSYWHGDSLIYWVNSERHFLSALGSDDQGMLIDVTKANDDLYFLGWVYRSVEKMVVWKNDVPIAYPDTNANPKAIAVSGSDVYIAGNTFTPAFFPAYWKNNVRTLLPTNWTYTYATSIFISGNDVYVAGFANDSIRYVSMYWKNGVPVILVDTTSTSVSSYAYSIAVSGNDVYVSGYIGNTELYWKNGIPVELPTCAGCTVDPNIPNAIQIYNGDVYVAGNYYDTDAYIPCYWKNDVRTILDKGDQPYALASSIFVTNQ